jgi:hypothetical protein
MNLCLNFLVCQKLHETRTKPLVEYLNAYISKHFEEYIYFLIGGFSSTDNLKIVQLSDTDDYLSCIIKTLKIFEYHKDSNFDWYFIGDDDTFINFKNLKLLLQKLPPDELTIYGYVDWAPTLQKGNILHAHGGSGILFNKKTFQALKTQILNTNFSIQHEKHSDVSLALNVLDYNNNNAKKINFIRIEEMLTPHLDVNSIDINKAITVHTKDRITFEKLKSNLK